jgi:hypothetical protein
MAMVSPGVVAFGQPPAARFEVAPVKKAESGRRSNITESQS